MSAPDLDRLTILERAQLLHDATLRRHGEMLDGLEDARMLHEARMAQHEATMAQLRDLMARQIVTQQDLAITQTKLHETLEAIKDLLGRHNGH